jgi:hypothetical protein
VRHLKQNFCCQTSFHAKALGADLSKGRVFAATGGNLMKWHHVQENWLAFFDAITARWPGSDETGLEEVDGDQRAFIRYIAELTGQDITDARDEIREWLIGELPADVIMDPHHDDHSIRLSAKFLPEGEDESDDDARFGDDEAADR